MYLTALTGLLLAAYLPAVRAPFYLDDFIQIVDNPATRFTAGDWGGRTWRLLSGGWPFGRPLAVVSFGWNRLIGGDSPAGFRLVNLFFHLGSSVLLFLLLRRMARFLSAGDEEASFSRWFPPAASLLWALHPTHSQTVTYVVQRMNGGMAFFFLGATLAFFRGLDSRRPWAWHGAAFLLGALSLGFKQNALLLPLLWGLWLLLAGDRGGTLIRRGARGTGFPPGLIPVGAISLLLAAIAWKTIPSLASGYGFSWKERLLTEARVIPHYVGLYLFPLPSRLHLNYDFPLSTGLFSPPSTFAGIALILAWILAIFLLRKRDAWISFGLGWALLAILPESSLAPIDLVFEHRMYLPSVGLTIAAVRAGYRLACLVPVLHTRPGSPVPVGALAGFLVLLAALTLQRNMVWASPEKFWAQELRLAPGSVRAIEGKMVHLLSEKRYEETISLGSDALKKGLRDEDAATVWNNMALAYAGQNDWERMTRMLEESLRQRGERKYELFNLGVAYYRSGRMDRASKAFLRVLELDEGNPDAWYYLGRLKEKEKDFREAARMYGNALRKRPDDVEALKGLEDASVALKDWENASRATDRLAETTSAGDAPDRWFLSGYIYTQARRIDKAETVWRKYLAAFPGDPAANFNLACVLSVKGDLAASLAYLDRALLEGLRNDALFHDPDLEAVRHTPGFGELLRKYGIRKK